MLYGSITNWLLSIIEIAIPPIVIARPMNPIIIALLIPHDFSLLAVEIKVPNKKAAPRPIIPLNTEYESAKLPPRLVTSLRMIGP